MKKITKLRNILRRYPGVVIAFSGGVDSTLLLKVAKDVLNDRVIAVTVTSAIFPRDDIIQAKGIAHKLKVSHIIIHSAILKNKKFIKNPEDRCYYCKKMLFKDLTKIATKYKYVVLEASNKSDLKDFRPGIVATKEMGVKSPFIESDIKKEEIRVFAKRFGLPNWARPSNACLATRIPYGKKIDKKTLKRIDYAETYLRRLNLTQLRVREHFPIARIEIRTSEFKKILIHRLRIIKYFKRLGYRYITIDLSGYKSGSMNILE